MTEYRTRSGRVLTDADVEALADEAERGYDVEHLRARKVVVKIIGGIEGLERHPELMEQVGRWLLRYDPEKALLGEQWIWTTDDPEQATEFDPKEWFDLYGSSIGTRPWDGKPDRPIAAFHVEVRSKEAP